MSEQQKQQQPKEPAPKKGVGNKTQEILKKVTESKPSGNPNETSVRLPSGLTLVRR